MEEIVLRVQELLFPSVEDVAVLSVDVYVEIVRDWRGLAAAGDRPRIKPRPNFADTAPEASCGEDPNTLA
ncbi:hypothetical protein [Streptomyces sp. NPDC005408]|uniref:hypothetical protein n=1 Tax=Streptomyces sp. NPDC005408 TaxID=3155341 RepID=UPI0033B4A1A9